MTKSTLDIKVPARLAAPLIGWSSVLPEQAGGQVRAGEEPGPSPDRALGARRAVQVARPRGRLCGSAGAVSTAGKCGLGTTTRRRWSSSLRCRTTQSGPNRIQPGPAHLAGGRFIKYIARKQWFAAGSDDMFVYIYNYNTAEKIKAFEVVVPLGRAELVLAGASGLHSVARHPPHASVFDLVLGRHEHQAVGLGPGTSPSRQLSSARRAGATPSCLRGTRTT